MTALTTPPPNLDGIDPDRLADAPRRVARPGAVSSRPSTRTRPARRATPALFKTVKEQRRAERRDAIRAADRAVIHATATGRPGRIDDETQGLPLRRRAAARRAGTLLAAARLLHLQGALRRGRRLLPPALPAPARREPRQRATPAPTSPAAARCSPAAGRRSACTSRCGCCATARTRRSRRASRTTPSGASPRWPDSADWLHRLRIVGIDLRDPAQVDRARRRGRRAGAARHPHQQRRADRAPLARGLRAARARRGARRCPPARCRRCSTLRPHQRRRTRRRSPARSARPHWTPTPRRARPRSR